MIPQLNQHIVSVPEEYESIRLDKFLSLFLPQFTRSRLQGLIEQGNVSREGKHAILALVQNAAMKIKAGEIYHVSEPQVVATEYLAEKIALDIVYEDAHLLVINKPAGMTVHPAPGATTGTLVHALLAHCGDTLSGIGGVARPGIVHRIDKDTTGLLVVAKHDAAHQKLSAQLKERILKRVYMAICWGAPTPRSGEIEAPLARHPRMRKQMAVVVTGRYALTNYETEKSYNAPGFIIPLASRLRCELDTGRTHQIRVHMAHVKAPLIGDGTYGLSTTTKINRLKSQGVKLPEGLIAALQGFNRQALHAAELTLIHPETNEEMYFEAPIPADMQALEKALATLTK